MIRTNCKPFIKPIVQLVTHNLNAGSDLVVSDKAQYEVWDNPRSSDPTHSMLSKGYMILFYISNHRSFYLLAQRSCRASSCGCRASCRDRGSSSMVESVCRSKSCHQQYHESLLPSCSSGQKL